MLDQRIFDLLNTLSAAGVDWLAQEVVEGLLKGHVAEEPVGILRAVRAQTSRQYQDSWGVDYAASEQSSSRPIPAELHVDWAAAFVSRRLEETIALMSLAADRLDTIINGPEPRKSVEARIETRLARSDIPDDEGITRSRIEQARHGISALRVALEAWCGSPINGDLL
jgi:hypothetical protein